MHLSALFLVGVLTACSPTVQSIDDFETGNLNNWIISGMSFAACPCNTLDYPHITGAQGKYFIISKSDEFQTGEMTSYGFVINRDYVNFLLGTTTDRSNINNMTVSLIIDGKPAIVTTPRATGVNNMQWVTWDVSAHNGKTANIVIRVSEPYTKSAGGSLLVDQFEMTNTPLSGGLAN